MKDWKGNANNIYKSIGASNHTDKEREVDDYYATDPIAITKLLEKEKFSHYVWECACGGGHLSEELKKHGYDVKSSDIVDRDYPGTEIIDFLQVKHEEVKNQMTRDIITNPPYKFAKEFIEKALEVSMYSTKIAMFLKLTFLESKSRLKLFKENPPKYIYVFSERVLCAKNAEFQRMKDGGGSAVAYAWFIWEKGFAGAPTVRWL